jgi:thiol:disulfide interchange protein DsbC
MKRIGPFVMVALAVMIILSRPAIAADPPPEVVAALEKIVPGIPPDSIKLSPLPGLYEVAYGPSVVYMSTDGRFLIQGDLVNVASGKNYTRERRREQRRDSMAATNVQDRVVFGPDDAKYTVDVFTDIDCPYCVRLHNQMADYNRLGIRIRYLAFPRTGIPSPSYDKWVSVWCSDDQQVAMSKAKNGMRIPEKTCENPVKEQFALGRAVGVRGTPSIIFEDGQIVPGYVPPQELLEMLEENEAG